MSFGDKKSMERLGAMWCSQFILRYHAVPAQFERQNIGAHSFGVAVILLNLWPNSSANLIKAALFHDISEVRLGDMPYPAKNGCPELKAAFKIAEERVNKELDLDVSLNEDEQFRLHMADRLDIVLFTARNAHVGVLRKMKNDLIKKMHQDFKAFEDRTNLTETNLSYDNSADLRRFADMHTVCKTIKYFTKVSRFDSAYSWDLK